MSNPHHPGHGPGKPHRPRRRASGRMVAWTAAGAAGLALIGGIAGTASGAFDGDSGKAAAANGGQPAPSAFGVPDPVAPSPTETSATPTPTKASPSRKARPTRTPTPRVTRSRPAAPRTKAPAAPPATTSGGPAAQVIALVNKERAKQGCRAVTADPLLTRAAQAHSADMKRRGFFDHTNPDGKDPGDRITATGYRWSTYGENIAKGQPTAASVMKAWMNSPGHRANILNCRFAEIGVGLVTSGGPYWTQNFGTAR
ncbi:hypothetical protein E1200_12765 [Actinomadura sp. GC306]|uniref:CAP domain-containing protein n=1 Tax=Actinomadura sp. GC306 TaxID=2530367 RepID=UPI0010533A09|nr:CAP domain-containing protein [Actinomadura sp. GC306]TDC68078.1 hypothetical protein E1200_12765 [Actinomadura sp. GC306]